MFLPTHLHHLAVDRSVIVIESNTVVIDGGGDNNQQPTLPSFRDPKFPWSFLRIQNGDLHIVDTNTPELGLIHAVLTGQYTAFVRLSRTV